MQIALTKKLAVAMGVRPAEAQEGLDPIFTWTVNWTKSWEWDPEEPEEEDLLILVNNATRFIVAIYKFTWESLDEVGDIARTAIKDTLFAMNFNPEMVEEYMNLAGDFCYVANRNRKATAWVNKAGLDCAWLIDQKDLDNSEFSHKEESMDQRIGVLLNQDDAMAEALTKLTGKPAYNYRAFEIQATLDLLEYKAIRKFIVPAAITFHDLHQVMQKVFDWKDCHLYDFTLWEEKGRKPIARLVPFEEDLEFDEKAILMGEHSLSEFFPTGQDMKRRLRYTYDMGDFWEHEMKIIREFPEYDKESPYLLEAIGQTPPEDVGGVDGFLQFREIMLNPKHPDYMEMIQWSGFWTTEISPWQSRPRIIKMK